MVKTIAIVIVGALAVAIAAVLIFAATKPDSFRVERTTVIKAPPDRIYPLITDLRGWSAWSPYEKKDPAMKRSFSGAASGTGAVYEWDGDRNVGKGRMEIIEATPPSRVVIKLDFIAPFEGHSTAEFTMNADGGSPNAGAANLDSTNVIWAMYGPQPFMAKVMGVFFDMDSMIGKDFEAGLANLKILAESGASSPAL